MKLSRSIATRAALLLRHGSNAQTVPDVSADLAAAAQFDGMLTGCGTALPGKREHLREHFSLLLVGVSEATLEAVRNTPNCQEIYKAHTTEAAFANQSALTKVRGNLVEMDLGKITE